MQIDTKDMAKNSKNHNSNNSGFNSMSKKNYDTLHPYGAGSIR